MEVIVTCVYGSARTSSSTKRTRDPVLPVEDTGKLRFVNCVRVAAKRNSGNAVVDAELLQYHCSVALMVQGGNDKE